VLESERIERRYPKYLTGTGEGGLISFDDLVEFKLQKLEVLAAALVRRFTEIDPLILQSARTRFGNGPAELLRPSNYLGKYSGLLPEKAKQFIDRSVGNLGEDLLLSGVKGGAALTEQGIIATELLAKGDVTGYVNSVSAFGLSALSASDLAGMLATIGTLQQRLSTNPAAFFAGKLREDVDYQYMVFTNSRILETGGPGDPAGNLSAAQMAAYAAKNQNLKFTPLGLLDLIGEYAEKLDPEAAARGREAAFIIDMVVEEVLGYLLAPVTLGVSAAATKALRASAAARKTLEAGGKIATKFGEVVDVVVERGGLVVRVGRRLWHIRPEIAQAIRDLVAAVWDDLSRAGSELLGRADEFFKDLIANPAWCFEVVGDAGLKAARRGKPMTIDDIKQVLMSRFEELGDKIKRANSPDVAPNDFTGTLRGVKQTLPGVKTKLITYKKIDPSIAHSMRSKFNSTDRPAFLKKIANENEVALTKAGLSKTDIAKMKNGEVPSGYQVHHKVPLDAGGTNDPSNLILMKNEPFHKTITNYQNDLIRGMQPGEVRVFDYPIPEGFIYPP
jgi:hypothetical protein